MLPLSIQIFPGTSSNPLYSSCYYTNLQLRVLFHYLPPARLSALIGSLARSSTEHFQFDHQVPSSKEVAGSVHASKRIVHPALVLILRTVIMFL